MIFTTLAVLETEEQRNEIAKFYMANKDRFYAVAYSKLHNKADAEDAIMDAFSKIVDKPESFFAVSFEKRAAYMTVIVKNTVNKIIKNKIEETADSLDECYDNVASEISIEDIYLDKENAAALEKYIRAMPDVFKAVLYLKIIYNKRTDEIAAVLNITESAARKRLYRGKKMVENFLEERRHD